ncbi:alpha-galactosidase [Actinopolymorpha sp. B11F2]|uniref:alpha-galactosidase n=1 Tax=Actinopolymorpha sp. B11F2 TaxID=3160862 RepID=UPI0032E42ACB
MSSTRTTEGCRGPARSMTYALSTATHGLLTQRLALDGQQSWTVEGRGPVFTVIADGVTITGDAPGLEVGEPEVTPAAGGVVDERISCRWAAGGSPDLAIDWHVRRYPDLPVVETWTSVTNCGAQPVTVERIDSLGLALAGSDLDLLSHTSGWGLEFDGVREKLADSRTLGTLRGRSSADQHPWFGLVRAVDGAVLCGGVAWSGNWVVRFEQAEDPASFVLTGGLHDTGFATALDAGLTVTAPPVVLALGYGGDLDTASIALARAARAHWMPRSALADRLPVEWNHWWTYEDHSIDEAVFTANADAAAELGAEVCTLDAGWFGPAEATSQWTDVRGDWDRVNTVRFPSGLRSLADHVHKRGMSFGLWCEIEALGPKAAVATRRADLPALRDGEPLGYACLGNPAAWDWAHETLDRLVRVHGADWIKLDFNLDPGLGCNRTDHGHGAGDGLFAHYTGYYRLLDVVRADHPDLVLENCSSGGLRIDLGILRRTHLTFLSDPDWPEHGLQLLWGASLMVAPNQLLHWGFSEWYGDHRHQTFDPRDPALAPHQLDYYRRIAMLGGTGLSIGLVDLPDWVRERLRASVRTYQDLVRPYVHTADLHRLTASPRRFGEGERWAAVQYAMPDDSAHLVLAFRLSGSGEPSRAVRLHALDPVQAYDVHWHDADRHDVRTGEDLMAVGLEFALPVEGSELVEIRRR